MRLSSFLHSGRAAYGVVVDQGIVDLSERIAGASTLRDFLALTPTPNVDQIVAAGGAIPLADIVFEPVIPSPDKIICVGLNYNDHVTETNRTITEYPVLFARFAGSQIGHDRPLIRPKVSHQFDYEAELAVVIGRGGRDISEADALDHIGGYTCYNDASVRDWQRHTTQFLPGKTFAGTGAMGPWLVTPDEVGDPASLDIEMRLNGRVMQKANTSQLIHSIPSLIHYLSMILPLLPGDVIVTGTPGGVGARRNPQVWMKPGDVAEVEISRIGTLVNRVAAE
jgi:2-keto-4-pentenoate hydratase/2-oxohepta-3-ene-1,7-dioic acid hydratase in catechol pathway